MSVYCYLMQIHLTLSVDVTHTQATSSLMSFYSAISRHYAANWFNGPQTWEESAYTLTKVRGSREYYLDLNNSVF
jgi:hypothetical protein